MTEQEDADRLPLPEDAEHSADLAEVADQIRTEFRTEILPLDRMADGYDELAAAFNDKLDRRYHITLPGGEILQDRELARANRVIALLAQTFTLGSAIDEQDIEQVRLEAQVRTQSLLGEITKSNMLRQPWPDSVGDVMSQYGIGRRQAENALAYIAGVVLDDDAASPTRLTVTPEYVREQTIHYANLEAIAESLDAYQRPRELAAAIQRVPTEGTITYIIVSAYADVLRAFSLSRRAREYTDRHGGVAPRAIALYEAAISLAKMAWADEMFDPAPMSMAVQELLDDDADDRADEGAYNTLSEQRRLLMNASRVLNASVKSFAGQGEYGILFSHDHPRGLPRVVEASGEALKNLFTYHADNIQIKLGRFIDDVLIDNPGAFWRVAAVLLAEQELLDEAGTRLETYHSVGLVGAKLYAELALRLRPRLWGYVNEQVEANRVAWLEQYIADAQTRIVELEEPFAFRARRIRMLGGTALPPQLHEEFDRYRRAARHPGQMPEIEEGVEQTLAIIIRQAQEAGPVGQEAYFDALGEAVRAIKEERLAVHAHGAPDTATTSVLLDTMQAADQMIDAGFDKRSRNDQLKEFLAAYFFWREQREQEAQAAEAEAIPEAPPEPAGAVASPAPPVAPAAPEQPRPVSRQDMQQHFAHTLDEVLDSYSGEIEYVDVSPFPHSRSGTAGRRGWAVSAEQEQALRLADADPQRFRGLIDLQRYFAASGKVTELKMTNPPGRNQLPYFVLYVHDPGTALGVCYLENLTPRWSTYAYSIDGERFEEWDDIFVVAESRQAARDEGALAFPHPRRGHPRFMQHYNNLQEFGESELQRLRWRR